MDLNSTFATVFHQKLENSGLSYYKLQQRLREVGVRVSYKKIYGWARGDLGRRWDVGLVGLGLVFSCHPAELLGLARPHHSWFQPIAPWPGPLVWALAGHRSGHLAKLLNVRQARVANWLRGSLPPVEFVFWIAQALRVEPQQLVPINRRPQDVDVFEEDRNVSRQNQD